MNYIILSLFFIMSTLQSCDKEPETQTGEIVFWKFTNTSTINCMSIDVIVYLNSNTIGTLNQDFNFYDSIPDCGAENCLTINKPIGIYNYKAECYCMSDNSKIGYWSGTLEVKEDSCTKIFFDIKEMMK